jgi:predicted RNase H-like HicB family nuclease
MIAKYEVIIYWSDEDMAFIADTPELPGCMAHGDTYDSALANVKEAMNLWLKTAEECNDPIPVPKGRRLAFA